MHQHAVSFSAVAALAAVISVACGALLGLAPGASARALGPIHSFALLTAVAVVLGQLLPEALGALGLPALVVFAAAFFLPRGLEWLRRRMPGEAGAPLHADPVRDGEGPCTDVGLELSYAAFILHRVGDGIGMAIFAGPLHADHVHWDVFAAIAGHTVPVTALVVMAFDMRGGRRNALLRTVGVVAATGVGLVLPGLVDTAVLRAWEPWITAAVGGLLMHVVSHGWAPGGPPTRFGRLMDMAAVATAILFVVFGGDGHAHEHHAPDFRQQMGAALLELGLETAPMLLLGLLIAAVLQTQGTRLSIRWLSAGGDLRRAVRGAALGLPLPVCACGILPVAHSLHRRGAAAAVVVAFLLATPELGVETFALTGRFLGWPFAVLRMLAAFALSVLAAWLVARALLSSGQSPGGSKGPGDAPEGAANAGEGLQPGQHDGVMGDPAAGGFVAQVVSHFEDLLYHIGAWTLVGLLAAAYMQAVLTPGALASAAGSGLDILIVTALSVPTYVCASSATPLAAVLLAKGMSPGAVLTGLLLGPATNVATVGWLRKVYGTRATLVGLSGLIGACWLLAVGVNVGLPGIAHDGGAVTAHEHGLFSQICGVLMVVLILRAVWRTGLRNWLSSLGEVLVNAEASEAHSHAHAHAHGHGHGHAHGHGHKHAHH